MMNIKTDVCAMTIFFHIHANAIHINTCHCIMRTGDVSLDLCWRVANYGISVHFPGAEWIIKECCWNDNWHGKCFERSLSHDNLTTTNPTRNPPEVNRDLLGEKPASNSPNVVRYGKTLFTYFESSFTLKQVLVFWADLAVIKASYEI
jgi:hypothetical protein